MPRLVLCLIYTVQIFLHDSQAHSGTRNGWRPLSMLEVYGFRTNNLPVIVNNQENINQINELKEKKDNEEFLPHLDVLEILEPSHVEDIGIEDQILSSDIVQSIEKDGNSEKTQDMKTVTDIQNKIEPQSKISRRSKELFVDEKVLLNGVKSINQYNSRNEEIVKDYDDIESTINYEVTEKYITEDEDEPKKPLELIDSTPNLKNKFLDILLKYNIKSNDNFSNYAISRSYNNRSYFNMKYGNLLASFSPYSIIIVPDDHILYQRYNLRNIPGVKPRNYRKFYRNQGLTDIFYNNSLLGQYQI